MFSSVRRIWTHFAKVGKPYFQSEKRGQAIGLLAILLALLLTINGLNVVNSYVGRDFMTAIAERVPHLVFRYALLYLAVFAASTLAGGFERYAELTLGLRWREWLTGYFLGRYLRGHVFHRLNEAHEIDNPDERISEDIRTYTTTSLSFMILVLNSALAVIAFSGVLWSISPWLFLAAVAYPTVGTLLTVFVGRRLVWLNHVQLQREANFRYGLVHVREHSESLALVHGQTRERNYLLGRLHELVENYRAIIRIIRNLRFFTEGYNYLTQLIPVLIVAPLYIRGEVEFGVVTQAAMAFAQVFNGFSLIVEQFQDLSQFAAVIGRLGTLWEAIEEKPPLVKPALQVAEENEHLAYQHVTLKTPEGRPLIRDLNLEVPRGKRLLVAGPNGAGKSALFCATAGVWRTGEGRIVRPRQELVLFLPEQPYTLHGTLKEQLLCGQTECALPDSRFQAILREVKLEAAVERVGGLAAERDWANAFSLGEQQLLAFARLLLLNPTFAFLDQAISALNEPRQRELYRLLARTSISYLSIAATHPALMEFHDSVLEIQENGTWHMASTRAAAAR
jgi:putative ATP-binding cassette transporter